MEIGDKVKAHLRDGAHNKVPIEGTIAEVRGKGSVQDYRLEEVKLLEPVWVRKLSTVD